MLQQEEPTLRLLTADDIPLIADYWLLSDSDFLIGMGVDLDKLPSREGLTNMLTQQLNLPDAEKASLAMILEVDGKPVGHCNVNQITFGKEATMHLHLWNTQHRQKGLGTTMVLKALPEFFNRLQLQTLWCEPYAHNPAPNKTLLKIGFEFIKTYVTIPGSLNFEQEVNRYQLTRERFEEIAL
ncbi:MAG: GNAT family N-acetyltransferase [Crocinitomicaceae bacterium]|nr:GNAT family N-acetyltransferase [Crocinitomicaceae bacterium]|tara:strand:- start:1309 stop:1857 length:549 start_codon:yes stop_codon:yes gene_type:complete